MAVRREQQETDCIYFCTVTCYDWLPLIEKTSSYEFIYTWFERLIAEGKQVLGYVIMPNHLHCLLYLPAKSELINEVIGEMKRFFAYHLVKELTTRGDHDLLTRLAEGVEPMERLRGKKHEVFRPSFDAKPCFTQKFLEQKLNYIHHNPVQGKWNLASDYLRYEHSSAEFYELGRKGRIRITHYADVGLLPPSPPLTRKATGE